jgi:hypothetical protein
MRLRDMVRRPKDENSPTVQYKAARSQAREYCGQGRRITQKKEQKANQSNHHEREDEDEASH